MIHVIGLGINHRAELSSQAAEALRSVQLVVGSERQLASISALLVKSERESEHEKNSPIETCILPKLSALKPMIESAQKAQQQIAVLASGDPLFYGIGGWFSRHFKAEQLCFYPAVSSLQMASHRLGVSLQNLEVLSVHGRPLAKLKSRLRQFQPMLLLTDAKSTPQAIAKLCVETGFPQAKLTVLEKLGYPEERIRQFDVTELTNGNTEYAQLSFDPLNVVYLAPGNNQGYLPSFPGIEDQHFITDGDSPGKGMITKRHVRLSILSLLSPNPEDVIWDIGAGCGGVAVELAYWQNNATITAIEHHPERLACLAANRERFGVVSHLHILEGRAPAVLGSLAQNNIANKVFIGGSDGELPQLLSTVWQKLPKDGVLVASAVTEQTKQHLLEFIQVRTAEGDATHETLQLAVSHGANLAGQLMYRPNLPVTLFKFSKTLGDPWLGGSGDEGKTQ